MKVLVTGGAGFIGSHLALRLLKEGYELVLVDNFHPYYSSARKRYQLEQVQKQGDVALYECDILDKEALQVIVRKEKPEAIVHLAGLPGVRPSLKMPEAYIDINIKGTSNVLACAGKEGVQHVIFGSSSSVYGERAGVPLKEEMADGKVLSPYAASKFGAESLCHAFQYMYGFQLNILRFFTVYGPWGRPDMAVAGFVRKLLHSEGITIYGKGTGRDYTYIDDITKGISLVLDSDDSDIYNLGSHAPVAMADFLKELKRHFPNMKVNWEGNRMGDVTSTWADITKAQTKLGYKPSVTFQEGLERTILWAKQHAHLI
ncbi:MAG: SDR family NAD(P)-dependent oxidoreductase [Ectobacillus sp.]